MNALVGACDANVEEEIAALIATLHATGKRLEELTGGEVDAVTDAEGGLFLLHPAQDYLRNRQAAKQAAVLDALPAEIAMVDSEGTILSVNEAWRQFASTNTLQHSGHSVGLNYIEICDEAGRAGCEDAQAVARGLRAVLGGANEFSFEYSCHAPTARRWFLMKVTPLAASGARGVVVMHLNITERKLAEEALRESEERFRGTFEQAAVGIAHVSLDGQFLRVNDKLCDILGYERGELLGKTFMELTMPENQAGALEARSAMLRGTQASFTSEKRYRRKGEELCWVNLVTTLERSPDGDPKYFISIYEDITARKQLEASLQRSQTLLRMAGRLSRMGPWSVELPGDKVMWSEEVCGIHEMPPGTTPTVEEALNFFAPECRGAVSRAFETCTRDGTSYDLELQIITVTGRSVWVRSICEAERDETGVIRRVQGNFQDITDLKQASAAMQKQQIELRVLFDLMPALIWFKDTENNILRVNQRVAEATGKQIHELEGKSALEIHPKQAAAYYSDDLHVIRSGRPKLGIVEKLRGPVEQDLWVQTDKVPYCDKDGRVIGVVVMSQDITERKQAEQRMAEQAALIDETRDAITVCDLDRRITFWSKGAERLYGWTAQEAQGRFLYEILHVDPAQSKAAEQAVRQTGEWNGEIHKTNKVGIVLTVDGRWTLMRDALGQPHSILTVDTDVTERKMNEKQFLRSQRMESIGTLAGGIAHDLNNVLAPILLGVDFLKLKYPEASTILDCFETSANRGAGMVRQLLSFAKGSAGERVSIQAGHLVTEMKELMQGTFPKNIEVRVSCDPGLPTVMGDASQLHQILLNLCVNARDAMPSGGILTLDARRLDVDAIFAATVPDAKPGRYVALRVCDTGTGIPADVLDRIFDPFFSTKGPDKGTGLGLSTVLGIVKGFGGFLQVLSKPGEGSTFSVHLPAEMGTHDSVPLGTLKPSFIGHGEMILLVDDEIGVLEVASIVLTELKYRVVTAIDGLMGLAKAIEHREELAAVITDIHMPHMDGLAFARALHRVLPNIPVIVGSGQLDDETAADLKLLGVTHRLDKPYTQHLLASMLAKVLAATGKH